MDYKLSLTVLFLVFGGIFFFQFTDTGKQVILNNTDRQLPEERKNYDLNIQSFTIGGNEGLNLPEEKNSSVPLSFKVNNSKNGLKGIEIKNISYQIKLSNSEEDLCRTKWTTLEERLAPGNSINTDLAEEGSLTFKECGLNQTDSTLTAILKIKYSYFSQATLYSSIVDKPENRSLKYSRTPDTIVEPEMSIKHPVTSGSSNLDIKFKSPDSVSYKVKGLELFTGDNISKNCNFSSIKNQNWSQTGLEKNCEISFQEDLERKDFALGLQANFTVIKEVSKDFNVRGN